MEIYDGYFKDKTFSGKTFVRGVHPPEGMYHLFCDILVRHTDGDYLLMQRDFNKKYHAGEFDATVTGGAQSGETPEECARRELFEETGIKEDNLKFINDYIDDERRSWFRCFYCETDFQKDSITLQEGETIAYKWVSEEDFIKYVNSKEFNPNRIKRFLPLYNKMGYIK